MKQNETFSMANRRKLLIVGFLFLFVIFSIPVLIYEGRYAGLFIFLTILIIAAIGSQDYAQKPVTSTFVPVKEDDHLKQFSYSEQYSAKTTTGDVIKDKPLTEAEKNVLYGK